MKLFNLKKKSKSKGFTLIEILLVVGFIALAGIGVYIVYDKVTTSQAVNTENRNVDTIRAGAKNIYAGAKDYTGISQAVLANAKVVPDSMLTTSGTPPSTTINSSFGGTIAVAPVAFNGGTNNAFTLTFSAVPADVCSRFVTTAAASFNKVVAGAQTVKDTSSTTGNAIDVSKAATGCAAAANTVVVLTSV